MQLDRNVVAERIRQEIVIRDLQRYAVNGMDQEADQLAELDHAALMALHTQLQHLPLRADWPYEEPSDFVGIGAARPEQPVLPRLFLAEEEIRDKILGGWAVSPVASLGSRSRCMYRRNRFGLILKGRMRIRQMTLFQHSREMVVSYGEIAFQVCVATCGMHRKTTT
jgi:hypothetical protein